MDTVIYYMTGTGNSLQIARAIAAGLENCQVRSMAQALRKGGLRLDAEAVGLVFPVYFFGIPEPVRRLIAGADWSGVQYTFAVANYGSMPGAALQQAEEALRGRGGRLDAGWLVELPDNYLPMFEVPPPAVQQKSFDEMARRTGAIAARVKERAGAGLEKSTLRFDRWIAPLVYPTVKKFHGMDRDYWVTEQCNGCGLCARGCPFGNLAMAGSRPQWQHRCEMCMRCIHICPQKAIQFRKGTLHKGRYLHPAVAVQDLLADAQAPDDVLHSGNN